MQACRGLLHVRVRVAVTDAVLVGGIAQSMVTQHRGRSGGQWMPASCLPNSSTGLGSSVKATNAVAAPEAGAWMT
jgi:hypothetical protein